MSENQADLNGKKKVLFLHSSYYNLKQCCPTLLSITTCGDRQLFKNGFLIINTLSISQILTKVATE
jgi:hypothetical protein